MNDLVMAINASGLVGSNGSGDCGAGCNSLLLLSREEDEDVDNAVLSLSMSDNASLMLDSGLMLLLFGLDEYNLCRR